MDPLNQNPNPNPTPEPANPVSPAFSQQPAPSIEPKKTSWGAVIGIIIILGLLVIAALYFWSMSKTQSSPAIPESQSQQQNTSLDAQSATLTDEELEAINSLEADTNSVQISSSSEIDALAQ